MTKGLSLLLWMSPFLHLGIFFPLGVWFAFPRNKLLRTQSFTLVFIQSIAFFFFYALELSYYLNMDIEDEFLQWNRENPDLMVGIVWTFGLVWLIANSLYLKNRYKKMRGVSPNRKKNRMSKIGWALLAWFLSVLFSGLNTLNESGVLGTPKNMMSPLGMEKAIVMDFLISLALFYSWFSKGETFAILRPLYARMVKSLFRRKYFLNLLRRERRPDNNLLHRVGKAAYFRDNILPGWGHIYVGDFWKGFPLLFIFLLAIFLFATAFFSWDSPLLGIQFLASWGLKPGIPDKEFFQKASNIGYMIGFLFLTLSIYILSKYLLRKSFRDLRTHDNPEKTSIRAGFLNNLPISLLFHLILLMIIMIIPFSIQRKKSQPKKDQASHFQPDSMEFYFIDPNIPDDTKDLNGGVMTGTDTPNKEEGEKISDEKTGDMGPKKGYIKKIKGKKVPPTYSNYISAKMRGPESYLDYWRRAPQPYSSVVSYTITSEGYVEDVQLVEGSEYPDQDLLTLELIESLSPLMSPPTQGKDIRVTELFWNGSLDPEAMPTALQKEMVTHFDGRYMEELD